jgi:hypothetical protein
MTKNRSGLTTAATVVKTRKNELGGSSSKNTKFGIVTQPVDWRAYLAVHPVADRFPLFSEKELRETAGDIKRDGLKVAITLWRPDDKTAPVLLDGRNRMDALALIGQLALNGADELCIKRSDDSLLQVTSSPRFPIMTGGDPEKLIYSLNLHRRHLTPDQKREVIAKLLKEHPEKSARQIAKIAKASPTTVVTKRAEMEAKGEVSKLDTRTDAKGVKQPTKKKTATATTKPKRSASQDRRELEAKQAHIDELEAAREHDQGLAEKLRAAEMKIVGLESEVEELKAENAKLREQLEAAQKVAA